MATKLTKAQKEDHEEYRMWVLLNEFRKQFFTHTLPENVKNVLDDCNYLTKWISKTAAEGTVRKLTHEKGLDGPFYDILRNSIVDMLEETSLGSKIEEGLGNVICPLLGGITTKMNSATDKLKQNALSAA